MHSVSSQHVAVREERAGTEQQPTLGDNSLPLKVVTWPQVENLMINLLRTRINLNYIQRPSPYRAVNTPSQL